MGKDSPPFCLLIPAAKNWLSWDAAVVLYAEEEGKRAVHVIFLQTTIDPDHEIYTEGLNLVRDAIRHVHTRERVVQAIIARLRTEHKTCITTPLLKAKRRRIPHGQEVPKYSMNGSTNSQEDGNDTTIRRAIFTLWSLEMDY
jgi:hypothetical protein